MYEIFAKLLEEKGVRFINAFTPFAGIFVVNVL